MQKVMLFKRQWLSINELNVVQRWIIKRNLIQIQKQIHEQKSIKYLFFFNILLGCSWKSKQSFSITGNLVGRLEGRK